MKERDIKELLLARVALLGGEARKTQWVSRKGAPDWRVMVLRYRMEVYDAELGYVRKGEFGGCFWVELKSPTGELSPAQVREIRKMRDLGERVEIISCASDLELVLPCPKI